MARASSSDLTRQSAANRPVIPKLWLSLANLQTYRLPDIIAGLKQLLHDDLKQSGAAEGSIVFSTRFSCRGFLTYFDNTSSEGVMHCVVIANDIRAHLSRVSRWIIQHLRIEADELMGANCQASTTEAEALLHVASRPSKETGNLETSWSRFS